MEIDHGRGRTGHPARDLSTRLDMCDHLHDTTTRYDLNRKLLIFLVFCPVCRTERVVEACAYEPQFVPAQPCG